MAGEEAPTRLLYVPRVQAWHADPATGEKVPRGQGRQFCNDGVPRAAVKAPGGQGLHVLGRVAPRAEEKVPYAQSTQSEEREAP